MACISLPDCILKQNLFLRVFLFLAQIKSFLIIIFSYPLRAVMKCGYKIMIAVKRRKQHNLRLGIA